jgi:hypothetical protein
MLNAKKKKVLYYLIFTDSMCFINEIWKTRKNEKTE